MPDQSKTTIDRALKMSRIWRGAIVFVALSLIGLLIFGLIHPATHKVLFLLIANLLGPALLGFFLDKTRLRGMLDSSAPGGAISVKPSLRFQPLTLLVLPVAFGALGWVWLLVMIGVKNGGDSSVWINKHTPLVVFWILMPQVATAYLCVVLNATYIGIYIAICIVYLTVTAALGGLALENGVLKLFGSYKAQPSPLVILSAALACCSSFSVLHFAVWSVWPNEYVNLHGIQDALYFSVVTMSTVGYGDILPIGHVARWLCVCEIVSGVLLLVVGVSASMAIWLQMNQPPSAIAIDSIEPRKGSEQADDHSESLDPS